jgi:hypothetical protein
MNCNVVQNRLLSCDRPELPPVDLKGHLVACASCRAWHRRLVRLEQLLPNLPVPPAQTKAAFVQRLVAELVQTKQPAVAAPQLVRYTPRVPSPKERGLRKMAVAFSLAAAMLLFAVGWWAWHRPTSGKVGSSPAVLALHDDLNRRLNERLATAGPPWQKVRNLADLAKELQDEAVALVRAEDAEQLAVLARFYGQVIHAHLLSFARQLPAEMRPGLEDIARQFALTESDLGRLAAAARDARADSLRTMADAAREGERLLGALARGENV